MAPQPKKKTAIFEAIVRFKTEGAQGALSSIIASLGAAAPPLLALQSGLDLASGAFSALGASGSQAYSLLIAQNEQLNQQIIKSASIIATNTRQIDQFGNEIASTQQELLNLQGPLRQAVLDLQVETRELAGVTTAQVNESFTAVLQNYNRLVGQTQRNNGDVLKSSVELTKGVVAAVGTIGLPLQQVQQEIRAILQGDLKNPDALLAKTLQISREEFDKARASGELIDLLIDKFDTFVVANQLASKSIGNIVVNLQDFVEQVARAAGEPLLEPIIESLAKLQDFLFTIQDRAEATGSIVGEDLAFALGELLTTLELLATAFAPLLEVIGSLLLNAFRLLVKTIGGLAFSVNLVLKAGKSLQDFFSGLATQVDEATQGLGLLGDALSFLAQSILAPIENLKFLLNLFDLIGGIGDDQRPFEAIAADAERLGDRFEKNAEQIAKLRQEIAETQRQEGLSDSERDARAKEQTDQLQGLIEKQQDLTKEIDRKEIIIRNRKVEGEANQASQKEALERISAVKDQNAELEILANRLTETGTIAEEAIRALETARQSAADATDLESLQKANKELLTATQLAFELGQVDFTQALKDIQTVATDQRITAQERLAALKEVDKLFKQQLNDRKATLDVEKELLNLAVAEGDISQGDQKIEQESLKLKELELKLEQAIAKVQLETQAGTSATVERAQEQVRLLEAQIQTTQAAIDNISLENLQSQFDRLVKQSEQFISFASEERRKEIEEFSRESIEFLSQITSLQEESAAQQLEDQLQLSEFRIEELENQLDIAQTVDAQRKIEADLAKEQENRLKISTDLSQQIKAAQEAQLALEKEAQDEFDRRLRLRFSLINLQRQELLGNLAISQESSAAQLAQTRIQIRNLQENIAISREIAESEETRADVRIRVLREITDLETELAGTIQQSLENQVRLEKEFRDLQRQALQDSQELVNSSLSRQRDLLQTQADLAASLNQLGRSRLDNQLSLIQERQRLVKLSQDENASAQERLEAERQLSEIGGSEDLQVIENERAETLAKALEAEKEGLLDRIRLSERLLEIEREQARVRAQITAAEAAERQLEAESRVLDLQNQRQQAANIGDRETVELLDRQIALQRSISDLAAERARFASEESKLTDLTFDAREAAQRADAQRDLEGFQQRASQEVRSGRLQAAQAGLNPGSASPDLRAALADLPDTDALFRGLQNQTQEFKTSFAQAAETQKKALDQVNSSLRELITETRNRQGVLGPNGSTNVTVNQTAAPDIAGAARLFGLS